MQPDSHRESFPQECFRVLSPLFAEQGVTLEKLSITLPDSNRESWLQECIRLLSPLFAEQDEQLPERIRISCGWPSSHGKSEKNRALGECWEAAASADGTVEIFINPMISEPLEVAATLVHELVHALGIRGHGRSFKGVAEAVGLMGPMRATRAGEALREKLHEIAAVLGPYPHAAIDPGAHAGSKQTTRLLKAVCPDPVCMCRQATPYTIRITRKWIEYGLPTCPCGVQMIIEEGSTA
jgi:hypothetical protein